MIQAYQKEAAATLKTMEAATGKWKVIMAYYACYNGLYSVLLQCGIKSEIHECTFALMPLFGFSAEERRFLKKLKEDRIKAQYYLKDRVLEDEQAVRLFVLRCRQKQETLKEKRVVAIRDLLSRALKAADKGTKTFK